MQLSVCTVVDSVYGLSCHSIHYLGCEHLEIQLQTKMFDRLDVFACTSCHSVV